MADFIIEWMRIEVIMLTNKVKNKIWHLKVDRASSSKGFGIGIVLYSFKEDVIRKFKLRFLRTNNEVEYEVLIIVISKGKEVGSN